METKSRSGHGSVRSDCRGDDRTLVGGLGTHDSLDGCMPLTDDSTLAQCAQCTPRTGKNRANKGYDTNTMGRTAWGIILWVSTKIYYYLYYTTMCIIFYIALHMCSKNSSIDRDIISDRPSIT